MKSFFSLCLLLVLSLQVEAHLEKSSDVLNVYIVAGQSNAVGFNHYKNYERNGDEFPKDIKVQPGVMTWLNGHFSPSLTTSELGSFGPELSLIHSLNKSKPKKKMTLLNMLLAEQVLLEVLTTITFYLNLNIMKIMVETGIPLEWIKRLGSYIKT